MSYCRFSDGDVYLYASTQGGIRCCWCSLSEKVPSIFTKGDAEMSELLTNPDLANPCKDCGGEGCDKCMIPDNAHFNTYDEAIEHLKEHQRKGDKVPSYAFEGLQQDKENGLPLEPYDPDAPPFALVEISKEEGETS